MAFGFIPVRNQSGAPFTGGLQYGYLDVASQAYFKGDLISIADPDTNSNASDTSLKRGEITIGAETVGTALLGIAQYFEYSDTSGNFNQVSYVTATQVAANTALSNRIKCFYVPITEDLIAKCTIDAALDGTDLNANYAMETATAGDTTTGLSGQELDASSIATTATLPLRLIGLSDYPGNDWASGAVVEVMFNATTRKAGVVGLTT